MKRIMKTVLVFVGILVVIIVVFWIALPMLGVASYFGEKYWIFTIVGSLVLSYGISHLLNKFFFK